VRRIGRILLDALTILAVLLCLGSAGLWVRSYWREDGFRCGLPARPGAWRSFVSLLSGRGGAAIGVGLHSPQYPGGFAEQRWNWIANDQPPIEYARGLPANRWGFGYKSFADSDVRFREIIFPLWLTTILLALLPLARLAFAIRRRRRAREGHCPHCGYDLRATPDRCPECGQAPRITKQRMATDEDP
jgi:hypothetical protein